MNVSSARDDDGWRQRTLRKFWHMADTQSTALKPPKQPAAGLRAELCYALCGRRAATPHGPSAGACRERAIGPFWTCHSLIARGLAGENMYDASGDRRHRYRIALGTDHRYQRCLSGPAIVTHWRQPVLQEYGGR